MPGSAQAGTSVPEVPGTWAPTAWTAPGRARQKMPAQPGRTHFTALRPAPCNQLHNQTRVAGVGAGGSPLTGRTNTRKWYQALPLTMFLEVSTGISRYFSLNMLGLGMKLGVTKSQDCLMLPDSAVTAWPLAHATQGWDLSFCRCLLF